MGSVVWELAAKRNVHQGPPPKRPISKICHDDAYLSINSQYIQLDVTGLLNVLKSKVQKANDSVTDPVQPTRPAESPTFLSQCLASIDWAYPGTGKESFLKNWLAKAIAQQEQTVSGCSIATWGASPAGKHGLF